MAVSAKIKNLVGPGLSPRPWKWGSPGTLHRRPDPSGRRRTRSGNRPFTISHSPITDGPEPAASQLRLLYPADLNTDFLGNLDDAGVIPATRSWKPRVEP